MQEDLENRLLQQNALHVSTIDFFSLISSTLDRTIED